MLEAEIKALAEEVNRERRKTVADEATIRKLEAELKKKV